jgi:formamidopyrimidine-DNA glycosylase
MPELPEVETIRRGLLPHIVGQTVNRVEVRWKKSLQTPKKSLVEGQKVIDIQRRGKVLIIELGNQYSLLIHLKMTGQLILVEKDGKRFGGGHPTKSMIEKLPDASTRVIFSFKTKDKLFFNDQRKFGWIKVVPNGEVNQDVLLARLGPEPLSDEFTITDFRRAIANRRAPIKAVILDQSTLAGVGNIYVDEALHLAKIHPATQAAKLNKSRVQRLHQAIIAVLKLSISHGGTSFTHYVNALGLKGDYLQHARAFRRTGEPCPVCGTPITKIRIAGRGTHVCLRCQPKPRAVR